MKRKPISLVQVLLIVLILVIIILGVKSLKKEDAAYQNIDSNGLTIETDNETVDRHDTTVDLDDYKKDPSESNVWYKDLFNKKK